MSPSKLDILIWRCCLIAIVCMCCALESEGVQASRAYNRRLVRPSMYKYSPRMGSRRRGSVYNLRSVYSQPRSRPTSARFYSSPTTVQRYSVRPTRERAPPTRVNYGGSTYGYPATTGVVKVHNGIRYVFHKNRHNLRPRFPTRFTPKHANYLRSTVHSKSPSTSFNLPTTRVAAPTTVHKATSRAVLVELNTPVSRSPTKVPTQLYKTTTAHSSATPTTKTASNGERLFDVDPSMHARPRGNRRNPTKTSRISKPTNPSSVLRVSTTSMSEAKKLVKSLGGGFKISFAKTRPKNIGKFDVNATTAVHNRSSSTVAIRSVVKPTLSNATLITKRPVGSSRRDTTRLRKRWWKGQHVCVSESPGLFGLPSEILRRIRTEVKCKERRRKYVCVESYGYGGRRPKKTITHYCCSGFHIDKARSSCQPGSITRRSERTDPTMLINRGQSPDLSGRGPPQATGDEKLTVFMPNDDVLVEALASSSDAQQNDSSLVRQFLENHVIPDQMLLSTEIKNDQIFTAISGNSIRVNFFPADLEPIMTVNCKKVGVRDVINDNSVVYFIDDIIKPVTESVVEYLTSRDEYSQFRAALQETGLDQGLMSTNGSFTLFAPGNTAFENVPATHKAGGCLKALMQNHIINHVICTPFAVVHSAHVITHLGENVTMERRNGEMRVKESELITSDVMATNGVIHIVNRMLEPTSLTAVLDVILSDSRLSDMMEMLQAAGTRNVLQRHHNFTVVAPTNKAFKKLERSVVMHLLSDLERLRAVLKFHVIPDTVTVDGLRSRDSMDTSAEPNRIFVERYKRNIRVMHKGRKRVVRKESFLLQCARVLRSPKLEPCNGAVLVVDKVLFPPDGPILATLKHDLTRSKFSIILTAIKKAKLEQMFTTPGEFTFFAPTDQAFQRLAPSVLRKLLGNTYRLARVIKLHLVEGAHCSHALLQRAVRLRSMLGSSITSCPRKKRIMLGRRRRRLRAHVTEGDLISTNGIVFGIDNILLPRRFSLH